MAAMERVVLSSGTPQVQDPSKEWTMKTTTHLTTALALLLATGLAAADNRKPDPMVAAGVATLKQIEKEMGFVPDFVRAIPPVLLPSFWGAAQAIEMNPNTALDGKTKELIGLAVAAQIPCDYCIYYHTEAAKLNGATETEIQEAVALASLTRQSSTLLNGLQVDKVQFKKDVGRLVKGGRDAPPHR
jgi:AhpD family alkylhydroperoxidase